MIIDATCNMFDVPAKVRINTVNCVGVMGKGVAMLFRTRFPDMYMAYKDRCLHYELAPGHIYPWLCPDGLTIINFTTKDHWRNPSQYEWIQSGLEELANYLRSRPPCTVTIPALGCGNGGLDWTRVQREINAYLCELPHQIYLFSPHI